MTRICLNKMISISLASLAAVKGHCSSLQVLELHVDKVTTAPAQTLQQALQLAHPGHLPNLKSLKLGGSIYSGITNTFWSMVGGNKCESNFRGTAEVLCIRVSKTTNILFYTVYIPRRCE